MTVQVVAGVMSRLDLLLHVNSVPLDAHAMLSSTLSHTKSKADLMVRSDTDILRTAHNFSRSMSVPIGMGPDIASHQYTQPRRRQGEKIRRSTSFLQDLMMDECARDKPQHVQLIDQLFSFIGGEPERAVSCSQFLQVCDICNL